MNWYDNESFLMGYINKLNNIHYPLRIAAFDLDDTLIYKTKMTFKLVDNIIINKIKDLVNNNFIIVVFTNQSGMSLNKNFDNSLWKKNIEQLVDTLFPLSNFYFSIYAAKKYDLYRKPAIELWNVFKNNISNHFIINDHTIKISKKSFYCGDAAGRIAPSFYKKSIHKTSKKGDFSDTDIKFALNIDLPFKTPEELFLQSNQQINENNCTISGFNPYIYKFKKDNHKNIKLNNIEKEMILLIGVPGSGKTTFVKKFLLPQKYVHINNDILKTKSKCLSLLEKSLKNNNLIVVDNTNYLKKTRMEYVLLAKKYNYTIRYIVINCDIHLAKHMNYVRHIYSKGKIPLINNIVYATYKKYYSIPTKDEYDKYDEFDFNLNKSNIINNEIFDIFMKYYDT